MLPLHTLAIWGPVERMVEIIKPGEECIFQSGGDATGHVFRITCPEEGRCVIEVIERRRWPVFVPRLPHRRAHDA
jgi:hypothetical protein